MRKIKKALALSLALAMGLSLVACGDKDDSTTQMDGMTARRSTLIHGMKISQRS